MTLEEGAGAGRRRVGDDWLLPANSDALELRRQDHAVTQRSILLDSYRHALTQAKVSFWIAVAFSALGSVILLGAVCLAVARSGDSGQQYPAIIASIAGTVTNLSAGVFYLQSTRTRLGMNEQARLIREDYLQSERVDAARKHVEALSDPSLRDRVLAQVTLSLLAPPSSSGAAQTSPEAAAQASTDFAAPQNADVPRPRPDAESPSAQP